MSGSIGTFKGLPSSPYREPEPAPPRYRVVKVPFRGTDHEDFAGECYTTYEPDVPSVANELAADERIVSVYPTCFLTSQSVVLLEALIERVEVTK